MVRLRLTVVGGSPLYGESDLMSEDTREGRGKNATDMMIGQPVRSKPTVQIPPWDLLDDSAAAMSPTFPLSGVSVNNGNHSPSDYSPFLLGDALTALQRYLPSNEYGADAPPSSGDDLSEFPMDAFSCDNFRMFEFKVRRCSRARSHDWTECPFAHPGEKARRRDPRKYHYSGTACPEFRKGACRKGDACEFAHGVFECWLHPARYRTQACKDGTHCRRRVCFFAHTPEQLRILPQQSPRGSAVSDSYDGSPLRHAFDSYLSKGSPSFVSSPTSILASPPVSPPSESPPMSPSSYPLCGRSVSRNSVGELAASMRNLQIGNKLSCSPPPPTWGASAFGSPRCSLLRPGCYSLPTTPTRGPTRSGLGHLEFCDANSCGEEVPAMERVDSGRDLRAKIYAKLSKENSFDRADTASPGPDVGWVSELVNMG